VLKVEEEYEVETELYESLPIEVVLPRLEEEEEMV
jgi:hypothetical protein